MLWTIAMLLVLASSQPRGSATMRVERPAQVELLAAA
jgi:hypothetical protein